MAHDVAGISQIESELHASSAEISLSLSLYILIQGVFPLFWSAVSEITGRKVRQRLQVREFVCVNGSTLWQKVYLASITLCTVGCVVAGLAKTIGVLIGMRCVQAAGYVLLISQIRTALLTPAVPSSAAVISIGAATLADIYEPHERGTMMGIYYWFVQNPFLCI